MVVDVARLDADGERLEGEVDDAVIDLNDEWTKPFGGLRYDLRVQLLGRELLARGRLEQDFASVCSRCGGDMDFTVKVPDFTVSAEVGEKAEFVDLTDELRESIILALPTNPVCGEECLGVCAVCGRNLNEGACGCVRDERDERWGALDALKPRGED